jgi:two-component system, NarL family, response regulator LiaR
MTSPISIFRVDDSQIVRSAVRAYFETLLDFDVVGEAASAEEFLIQVSELVPDSVLLELIMSDMDGIETNRHLKKISPRTQVVVLTSYYEDTYIFPAIEAGAVSYNLMKMEWLADELRRVYRGELRVHPRVATLILQKIRDEKGASKTIS